MPLACEMLRLQVQRQILRRRARREIRYLVPAQWQNVDLANKWTKLGPCLDFYVLGSSVHSVIGPIVSKAFAKHDHCLIRANAEVRCRADGGCSVLLRGSEVPSTVRLQGHRVSPSAALRIAFSEIAGQKDSPADGHDLTL